MSELKKLKTADLEALIKPYRAYAETQDEDADNKLEVPADFANNGERAAFIEATRASHGVVHEITEQDLVDNPTLKDDGVEVGELVLTPYVEPKDVTLEKYTLLKDWAGDSVDKDGITTLSHSQPAGTQVEIDTETGQSLVDQGIAEVFVAPKTTTTSNKGGKGSEKSTEDATGGANPILYFRNREVVSAVDKVVSGRLYKEVTTATDVQLLTEEEFSNQVGPRE